MFTRRAATPAPTAAAAGYPIQARTLAGQFLVYRGCWLAVGFLVIAGERHRYRRPRLAQASWALLAVEFAWLATRLRRDDRFLNGPEATTDAAVSSAATTLCLLAADPADQLSELTNWAFSIGLTSAGSGPIASPAFRRTLAETVGAAALYGLTGATRPRAARGEVLACAVQYLQWWGGGQTFATLLRRANVQIAEADAETAMNAAMTAAMRERARLNDQLHGGALDTLNDIRAQWLVDRGAARVAAAREALRLRHGLRDPIADSLSLSERLDRLAMRASPSGVRLEFLCDTTFDPPQHLAGGLIDTTGTVLTLLEESKAVGRALVRVSENGESPVVTIRYRGSELHHECREYLSRAGNPDCGVTVTAMTQSGARIVIEPR